MRHVIIVRYGEIAVKTGRIRSELERRLISNILSGLERSKLREGVKVCREEGRIYVYLGDPAQSNEVISVLRRVFGIKSLSPAVETLFRTIDDIVETAVTLWADLVKNRTFAVRCHRVGKHEFTSKDVEARVGEALLKFAKGVDLERPDVELKVEIRHNRAFFFTEEIRGPGGLPLGSEGKALALVSGGFDSPVAAWYVMRRGVMVDFLTVSLAGELDLLPALRVIDVLVDKWCIGYDPKIYVVHSEILVREIRENVKVELWNVVYKRCLYYIAETIALRNGYRALITGDVIGQVSSQTLDNMYSSEFGLRVPVLRPLAGFDKDEIIEKARQIGTYEYSCQVAEYCAIFSTRPKTWSTPEEVRIEFSKVKHVVNRALREITVLRGSDLRKLIMTLEQKVHDLDIRDVPEGAIILDIREKKIPRLDVTGAEIVETSIDDVFNIAHRLGRDRIYLVYCTSPLTARYVALKLRELGYKAYSLVRQ